MLLSSTSLGTGLRLLLVLAALAGASVLRAQEQPVKVELTGQRVVSVGGKETFASAEKAKPGDVVQYAATYRNTGKAAVQHLNATVPIPAGMELIAESAKPAATEASLDGKNFSPFPLTREVKNEAGAVEKQPVPLAQYRALRWVLPELAAEKSSTVTLRVRVVNNAAK